MQLHTKKYDAFCSHIFDYACTGRKAYRYPRGSNHRKFYTLKAFLKMAGGRVHISDSGSISKVGGGGGQNQSLDFFSPTTRSSSSVARNFKEGA